MFDSFLESQAEDKVDDAFYEYFSHHWSADYINPHILTILAMTAVGVVTCGVPLNDELATIIINMIKDYDSTSKSKEFKEKEIEFCPSVDLFNELVGKEVCDIDSL